MKTYVKTAFLFSIIAVSLLLIHGCAGTPETTVPAGSSSGEPASTEPLTTENPDADGLLLIEGKETRFTVIRPDVASDAVVEGAVAVKAAIAGITGTPCAIDSDWIKGEKAPVSTDTYEILIGKTNRTETEQAKNDLPEYGYVIKAVGNKVVILGTGDEMTAKACSTFIEKFLSGGTSEGRIVFRAEDSIREEAERWGLADYISSGTAFKVALTEVIYARPEGDYKVAQGAASDGTYAYFILRTSQDGDAVVAKYTLDTGKFVAKSEPFHVFHGNDMTFDTGKNLIIVAHGSSEGKILTTVDPDTLKVVTQTLDIPVGSGAITYNSAEDLYAISQGGKTLHIVSSDYKLIRSYSRTPTSGYTAQGMGSDDRFVYFPMSGSSDNILMTYTWKGEYVTDVHLPTTNESESMFWVNGTYYVNFYQSGGGAHLYRLDVYPAD